jgi:hypothetical protein
MHKGDTLSEFTSKVLNRWLYFITLAIDIIAMMGTIYLAIVQLLGTNQILFWFVLVVIASSILLVILSYFAFASMKKERDQAGDREQITYSITWGNREEWQLGFANGYTNYWEHDSDGLNLLLKGFIIITTMERIQVESVNINIGGQEYISDWQSGSFTGVDEPDICFEIPFNIRRGNRTANIAAIVDGKSYQGKQFNVEILPAKP